MKLAPLNGVSVCEAVFASDMDVFITCFNLRPIYQVGGLHTAAGISYKHYCHLLTVMKSFVAQTSRSLSSNYILALTAFCVSMA